MHADDVRHLFAYAHWVTARVLVAAASLPVAEFVGDAPSIDGERGLRSTLAHELESEEGWRRSLQGVGVEYLRDIVPSDYVTAGDLLHDFEREHTATDEWLQTLSDADLAGEATPSISGHPRPLWQYLLHVLFHASQQNANAAMLASIGGASPGNLDYGTWLQSSEQEPEQSD